MHFIYHFLILILTHFFINAQINGYIIDKKSNVGIEGVNIISETEGTFSDSNGQFFIEVPIKSQLQFSHIGYKDIVLIAEKNMKVKMEVSYIEQDEIIIKSGVTDEYI